MENLTIGMERSQPQTEDNGLYHWVLCCGVKYLSKNTSSFWGYLYFTIYIFDNFYFYFTTFLKKIMHFP